MVNQLTWILRPLSLLTLNLFLPNPSSSTIPLYFNATVHKFCNLCKILHMQRGKERWQIKRRRKGKGYCFERKLFSLQLQIFHWQKFKHPKNIFQHVIGKVSSIQKNFKFGCIFYQNFKSLFPVKRREKNIGIKIYTRTYCILLN